MGIKNYAISDKFEIVTKHALHHIIGIGDVDLRFVDIVKAERIARSTKGLLKEIVKEQKQDILKPIPIEPTKVRKTHKAKPKQEK